MKKLLLASFIMSGCHTMDVRWHKVVLQDTCITEYKVGDGYYESCKQAKIGFACDGSVVWEPIEGKKNDGK